MTGEDTRRHIPEIVACLKPIDPVKVVLFGSHAHGTTSEGSDLDLLVVTRSNDLPHCYREKGEKSISKSPGCSGTSGGKCP